MLIQRHVSNERCQCFADTYAVAFGTLLEPSEGDQSVDLDSAQGCGIERNTSAQTRFITGLTLTMTRAFRFLS
jgi:hypothetical protein